jgi:hypothetical protein
MRAKLSGRGEVPHDIRELERRLEEEERGRAITPLPGKPLVERMAAVGSSKEAIQQVSDMLDAITKRVSGRADEIPVGMRRGPRRDRRRGDFSARPASRYPRR